MARRKRGYYPIQFDVAGRKCVVAGGGKVAARKAKGLLDAGARVVVVSPDGAAGLREHTDLRVIRRRFRASDLRGAALAIAATDDEDVNRRVSAAARKLHIPVNVVYRPELCSFIVPAVLRRGRLAVAVSTEGASPMLAARLRKELEQQYGAEYADFLDVLAEMRPQVRARVADPARRKALFGKMSSPAMLAVLRRKGKRVLRAALRKAIADG